MIDIVGYENQYAITDNGQIWSYKSKRFLATSLRSGYSSVNLCKDGTQKHKRIHRLMAEMFIDNLENKPQVNHIDGNKLNNKIDNLEWCTAKENTKHAFKNGLFDTKEFKERRSKKRRFDDTTVRMLRDIYRITGKSIYKIAKAYKSPYRIVSDAINGNRAYANIN